MILNFSYLLSHSIKNVNQMLWRVVNFSMKNRVQILLRANEYVMKFSNVWQTFSFIFNTYESILVLWKPILRSCHLFCQNSGLTTVNWGCLSSAIALYKMGEKKDHLNLNIVITNRRRRLGRRVYFVLINFFLKWYIRILNIFFSYKGRVSWHTCTLVGCPPKLFCFGFDRNVILRKKNPLFFLFFNDRSKWGNFNQNGFP